MSLTWLFFTVTIQLSLFYIYKITFQKHKINKYTAIQKIHEGEVPRIGGLIFTIPLIIYLTFHYNNFSFNILSLVVSILLIFSISFYEDLQQILSPKFRLFFLFLSSLVFTHFISLPDIKIPVLEIISKYQIIKYALFILSLMLIINGLNLIDGLNGLSNFTFFSILISNFYLANEHSDQEIMSFILIIISMMGLVFFLNFPLGKIFMGDSGAYIYAFISGAVTIINFQRNESMDTLIAMTILAYPITELLFSIFRKIKNNYSPLKPDVQHLHHLMFNSLKGSSLYRNNTASLLLAPVWFSPFLLTIIHNNYPILPFGYYLIYLIIYLLFYNHLKKKNS